MSDEDAKALEVLRLFWEPEYSVGYDDEQLGRMLGDEAGTAR